MEKEALASKARQYLDCIQSEYKTRMRNLQVKKKFRACYPVLQGYKFPRVLSCLAKGIFYEYKGEKNDIFENFSRLTR